MRTIATIFSGLILAAVICGLSILTIWPWIGFIPEDWRLATSLAWGVLWVIPLEWGLIRITEYWEEP